MLKQQFRTGPRLFSQCLGGFVFNQGWWSWILNSQFSSEFYGDFKRYSATLIGDLFCRWFRFADFDFLFGTFLLNPKWVLLSIKSDSKFWNIARSVELKTLEPRNASVHVTCHLEDGWSPLASGFQGFQGFQEGHHCWKSINHPYVLR